MAPVRRKYVIVFAALALLTALEVGVIYAPIARAFIISALVSLALSKVALVALFFMHLKNETRQLKLTILVPLATPTVFASVLIAESAWRHFL